MLEKFSFELIELNEGSRDVKEPIKKEHKLNDEEKRRFWGNLFYWECSETYLVNGPSELWEVVSAINDSVVYSFSLNRITLRFTIESMDPTIYNRESTSLLDAVKNIIRSINNNVEAYNALLPARISRPFYDLKNDYLKESNFFAAIKVNANPNAPKTYSVPTVERKRTIQKPTVTSKTYVPEPTIDDKAYHEIIDSLIRIGWSMERKPSLYVGKTEEGLRDFFLVQLEMVFLEGTVTGETFNRSGKTDILLKNTDGTNLFVGECKVWKGQQHYLEALSQLLQYLTWNDSKTALIIFVKSSGMSAAIKSVKDITLSHPSSIKLVGARNERSFQYIFKLPQDDHKQVQIEVMLFHFDKQSEGRDKQT
ncbi:hypothetical protein [Spirosoma litoris]